MKTALQKNLAALLPWIAIETLWSHDPHAEHSWSELSKPGNCFDGASRDDWDCWESVVRATAIVAGEIVTGSDYLCGIWEKFGDHPSQSNPEISGYGPDMTFAALEELAKQLPGREAEIKAAIESLSRYSLCRQ